MNGYQKFETLQKNDPEIFYSKDSDKRKTSNFAKHFHSNGREKYIGEIDADSGYPLGRGKLNFTNEATEYLGHFSKNSNPQGIPN